MSGISVMGVAIQNSSMEILAPEETYRLLYMPNFAHSPANLTHNWLGEGSLTPSPAIDLLLPHQFLCLQKGKGCSAQHLHLTFWSFPLIHSGPEVLHSSDSTKAAAAVHPWQTEECACPSAHSPATSNQTESWQLCHGQRDPIGTFGMYLHM